MTANVYPWKSISESSYVSELMKTWHIEYETMNHESFSSVQCEVPCPLSRQRDQIWREYYDVRYGQLISEITNKIFRF